MEVPDWPPTVGNSQAGLTMIIVTLSGAPRDRTVSINLLGSCRGIAR